MHENQVRSKAVRAESTLLQGEVSDVEREGRATHVLSMLCVCRLRMLSLQPLEVGAVIAKWVLSLP